MSTPCCHSGGMGKDMDVAEYRETFTKLKEVRAKALEHYQLAQKYHAERREILRGLVGAGFSQAGIGRELGVSRQAIQKMMAG